VHLVVNEAVELAKQFSTADSPGFVNALLDKILKRVLAESPAGSSPEASEPA
jgi:transcription termination factor NusB